MDASTIDKPKRPIAGIAITRTIINPRRQRYTSADLLRVEDLDPPPRVLVEDFDAYGYPREYQVQNPTPERARKAGELLQGPEVSRKASRYNHTIRTVFDAMADNGTLSAAECKAGNAIAEALEALDGSPTSCTYGEVRRGGGRKDRMDIIAEYRETIETAKRAISDRRDWQFLEAVAKDNLTSDKAPIPPRLAHRGGVIPERTVRRHYAETLQRALSRAAKALRIE